MFPVQLISHSPLCNIIVCSDPPTVPNAVFSLELAKTVIFKYNCSGGLNLIGDNAVQCQDDATWTNIMFTCTSKYHMACDVLELCLIATQMEGFKSA
jgi:hypothetical protein